MRLAVLALVLAAGCGGGAADAPADPDAPPVTKPRPAVPAAKGAAPARPGGLFADRPAATDEPRPPRPMAPPGGDEPPPDGSGD